MAKTDNLNNELQHCIAATHYLQQLLQTSFPNVKGEQANFNAHNLAMLNRLLGQMISADDYESLQVSHQQFHQYMDALAESLELNQDSNDVLGQYEYFQGFLNDIYGMKYDDRANFILTETASLPEDAGYWAKKFEQLKSAETEALFEERRKAILHELLESSENQRIQEILSYGLLKRNVDELVEMRSSYLNSSLSRKRLIKDVGWMGVGAAILGAATFFGFAATAFFVPAVVLAAGVLAYSVVDTIFALKEMYEEVNEDTTGENELSKLPQELKDQFDLDNLKERRHSLSQKVKKERLLLSVLGGGASLAGLGLGALALVSILPALAFPPAFGIAIAVLSIMAISAAATILGVKIWRTMKANKAFKELSDKEFKGEMDTFEFLNSEKPEKSDLQILHSLEIAPHPAPKDKEASPKLKRPEVSSEEDLALNHKPIPVKDSYNHIDPELKPSSEVKTAQTEQIDIKHPLDSLSITAKKPIPKEKDIETEGEDDSDSDGDSESVHP